MASKKHRKRTTKRAAIAARAASQEHGKKAKALPAGRTTLADCLCRNEFQDGLYGHGRRVFNLGPAHTGAGQMACTSCGSKRTRVVREKG